ncbi:MAG: cytochrome C oxidase subunit IV family protein [Nitrospiraceae bacterium]|nr:MAG: cytochrome C oxidase subunit IV family protein [Nitrospiraceae bacterium]
MTQEKETATHTVSYRANLFVWLALLILTAVTVMVAGIDLGRQGILVNLLIASVKAGLIVFIFMHMKYESPLLKLMLLMTLGTLTVIIMMTFLDTLYR